MSPRPLPYVRLHKYLADLGIGSRRAMETWIAEGKIKVNGRIAKVGDRVNGSENISVNGRGLRKKDSTDRMKARVLMYHKPEGEISSRKDPSGKPSIFRNLPKLRRQRWVAVGRLDINTTGLLLFTNDGQLANRLMHPSSEVEREYLCRVYGEVSEEGIKSMLEGITIDGQLLRFQHVRKMRSDDSKNNWYKVIVLEGRYREVRRLWEAVGCQMSRLKRIRYGTCELPKSLRQGHHAELNAKQLKALFNSLREPDVEVDPEQAGE